MAAPVLRSAVVLAGGRATRIGGTDKPRLTVGGTSMLQTAVDAAADAGCTIIVIVADPSALHVPADVEVRWTREQPRHAGPGAALAAGLAQLPAQAGDWTLVLAADLPRAADAVTEIATAMMPQRTAGPARDAVVLVDASGREQWLTAAYRLHALTAAVARAGELTGAPVRALVAGLSTLRVAAPAVTDDVDTWSDLARARGHAARAATPAASEGARMTNRTLPPEALDEWAATLREQFGLAPEDLPISLILDLARDVAHDVARPAAPFSAFAAGFAAGKAGGTPEQTAAAIAAVVELARGWADRDDA